MTKTIDSPRPPAPAVTPAKLARPRLAKVFQRTRLHAWLDDAVQHAQVLWIEGPPGAGKTTLAGSWLDTRKRSCLWYQVDSGDTDPAAFFHYLGIGAQLAAPGHDQPLPHLTPEYLPDVVTFARRYFEQLGARLPGGSVIVFDNIQELGVDSRLDEILATGLEHLPHTIQVLCLSRTALPASLTRLHLNGQLACLNAQTLQLNDAEAAGVATVHGASDPEDIRQMQAQARGWAAGLVLMVGQHPARLDAPANEPTNVPANEPANEPTSVAANAPNGAVATPQVLFAYFAYEILRSIDAPAQSCLLQSALLPKMSGADVEALTGYAQSARILAELQTNNTFTYRLASREVIYEYHPLFREFLLARLRQSCAPAELDRLQRVAAGLLVARGEIEAGVDLLRQIGAWTALLELILRNAQALAAQGRIQTLDGWLQSLPAQLRDDNPWALYWLGICRLPADPAQARSHLEKAFDLFEQGDDSSPLYLVWSAIVDSISMEARSAASLDHWLGRFESLADGRQRPALEIDAASVFSYVGALAYRHPGHPGLPRYAERAEALYLSETDPERRFTYGVSLLSYYLHYGNVARAEYLLLSFPPQLPAAHTSVTARVRWQTLKALHAATIGAHEECLRCAMQGLALAQESGVHVFDARLMWFCIVGHLHAGEVSAAREVANRMAGLVSGRSKLGDSLYNSVSLGISLYEGEVERAVEEGLRSVALANEGGPPDRQILSLAYSAYAWARSGDTDRALRDIEAAHAMNRGVAIPMTTYLCTLIEAAIRRLRGDHAHTLRLLREVLAIGKQFRIAMTPLCCRREELALLYNLALEADIERDYVRALIVNSRLPPPAGVTSEHWPWPIRIRTLGRFNIEREGAPATASRKESRKPLDLLKLLVGHVGEAVPLARLCAALWPDADGDAARNSFDTTLGRLRKLLGGERHVHLRAGGVSLDATTCWTDLAALESCFENCDRLPPGADAAQVSALAERALALCQGEFLPGEDDFPDVLGVRVRVRARFTRQMGALGARLEAAGRHAEAARIYERVIEQQPLAEEIYRRLIGCLIALGQRAEAYETYRRCRQHLSVVLGISPAPATEAMVAPLRNL